MVQDEREKRRERFEAQAREHYLLSSDEFKKKFFDYLYGDGQPGSADLDNVPWTLFGEFQGDLTQSLGQLFVEVYTEHAKNVLRKTGVDVSWDLVHERARDWSRIYTYDLVKDITSTDREILRDSLSRHWQEGMTLEQTRDLIARSPAFGPKRADLIAITEITRTSVQGELWAVRECEKAGFPMESVWNTNADELVCPICGPRNQKPQGTLWSDPPPAHPRCRCWLDHVPMGRVVEQAPQEELPAPDPEEPNKPTEAGEIPTPDKVHDMGLKKYVHKVYPDLEVDQNRLYKRNADFEERVARDLYDLKMSQFDPDYLPTAMRYGYKADFDGMTGVPGYYKPGDGKIYLNPLEDWSPEAIEKVVSDGWWASPGIMKHELSHRAHYQFWKKLAREFSGVSSPPYRRVTPDEKLVLWNGVSGYSTYNTMETVAEVMSSVMGGRSYPQEIIDIYKRYGGPAIPGKVEYTKDELEALTVLQGHDYLFNIAKYREWRE